MIGTIKIGKSFRGVLNYCLEDKLEYSEEQKLDMERKDGLHHLNRAEIIEFNMCYGNRKELIEQFTDVRKLRPQLSRPVIHISLSFDPTDQIEIEKFRQITQDFAKMFGFDKNQYVSIIHKDTRHKHLHIVANRVGFDGDRVTDSQSYKRVAGICRELELKHDLKKVLSPRPFLGEKERLQPRKDLRKGHLQELIRQNLLQATNFSDFKTRMNDQNVRVIKGRGIAFQDDKKVYFKGSQLGYSVSTIEKIIGYPLQQRQELNQRIELTRRRELQRESWTAEQKERYYLKEYLKRSRENNTNQTNSPAKGDQLSIVEDLKSERLLRELEKPEMQRQIIRQLLIDEDLQKKQRQSYKIRH